MSSRFRPLSGAGPVRLHVPTSEAWLELALREFDRVLVDHAHCEKKAAVNALSLLQVYPDVPDLPMQMASLAREESAHLARVLLLMEKRGLVLGRDEGDPYAQRLQDCLRKTQRERRLDRLLVAAVIEARSCERLHLLSEGLSDPELQTFYRQLAQSEDGHQSLFHRLATSVEGAEVTNVRLEELLAREAEILIELPVRAAIH